MVRILLCLSACLLSPQFVSANAGPPFRAGNNSGELSGEPGGLTSIKIVRETLRIDMRPLTEGRPVRIDAIYFVNNEGEENEAELVFVGGSNIERWTQAGVWLDGYPVPFIRADDEQIPNAWQPPKHTPGIAGARPLPYVVKEKERFLRFALTLPKGESVFRVRYSTMAAASVQGASLTRFWQLAYVLAPARHWGGFGKLDVDVFLPPDWEAASDPPLMRNGDQLSGIFDGIPADSLALTVRHPTPDGYNGIRIMSFAVLVVAPIVALFASWKLGARMGYWIACKGRSHWLALPGSLAFGILSAAGALFITWMMLEAPESVSVPTEQRNWNSNWGFAFFFYGIVVAAPASFIVATTLTQLFTVRSFRTAKQTIVDVAT